MRSTLAAGVLVLVAVSAAPAASARPTARRQPRRSPTVTVVETTADLSQAMRRQPSLRFARRAPARHVPVIRVNAHARYQRFTGVGAAMTDTAAWLIGTQLSPSARSVLMGRLFGRGGINLSFLRVPMGASDFTAARRPYTYDDLPVGQSDPTLADFSISHDLAYIVPTLQQAVALNPGLELFANPWSPPAWMKANSALDNLGHRGTLRTEDYGPLAHYFVRFIQSYAQHGLRIAAIAAQNEPGVPSSYPGLELSGQAEAVFVAHYLRPALAAAGLAPKVFGWDLSWGPLDAGTPLLAGARKALSGVSWHCYFGSPTMMSGLHASMPALEQVIDECTTPTRDDFPTPEVTISAFRNWANAVALWNLALDPQGGPVEPPNPSCTGCTGLVTVNPSTDEATVGSDYYQLGQVSKFVQPGATRIGSRNFVSYGLTADYQTTVSSGVDDVAFENPDRRKVLVLYNNSAATARVGVEWNRRYLTCRLPARAMATLIWK